MNHPNSSHSRPALPPRDRLSTAISSLGSLVSDSSRILDSLSTILPAVSHHDDDGLVSCPVNPHHRLHPRSLFPHSLCCPRSLRHLIPPLHYPNTLEYTNDESRTGGSFVETSRGSVAPDLCLSLEQYYADFGCNFFYRDCPGAVRSSTLDGSDKMFTLPSVLSAECANFSSEGVMETMDNDRVCRKFLPSESWAVENEVQGWNDYPSVYSGCVLRAVLRLSVIRECDLAIWVLSNSPKYGIVIDVPMGDHIVLLVSLCLKAIVREALSMVDCRDSESGSFQCPTLVEALVWLASQLSKLYGESYGKFFAVNILKHCVLDAAMGSFVFPVTQKEKEYLGLEERVFNLEVEGSSIGDDDITEPLSTESKGNIIDKVIFVSQVAAAIAALHERFLLEEKIKGERVSQMFTRHQRYDTMKDYFYSTWLQTLLSLLLKN